MCPRFLNRIRQVYLQALSMTRYQLLRISHSSNASRVAYSSRNNLHIGYHPRSRGSIRAALLLLGPEMKKNQRGHQVPPI
jgi:hypothetical protein